MNDKITIIRYPIPVIANVFIRQDSFFKPASERPGHIIFQSCTGRKFGRDSGNVPVSVILICNGFSATIFFPEKPASVIVYSARPVFRYYLPCAYASLKVISICDAFTLGRLYTIQQGSHTVIRI